MEDAGLDIVTDGGQDYENETDYECAELFHFMAHRLDGYAPYGDRIQVGVFDLPVYKPTVLGPVSWQRPAFKPLVEAAREATQRPLKVNTSLGPATLAALSTSR
jgi:5-methyltetrahydropteroyltriglutamate--homocysteine methyltransferase